MDQWKLVVAGGAITVLGMGVGGWLFGARPVVAQDAGWRECFVERRESPDTNGEGRIERLDLGHTILVPPTWVPVGGGGMWNGNPTATVVFCHC